MSELLDGTELPWHIVSGSADPAKPTRIPPPVTREPVRQALDPVAAAANLTSVLQASDAEVSRLKAAVMAAGTSAKRMHLLQAESRRRWFRSIADSLRDR